MLLQSPAADHIGSLWNVAVVAVCTGSLPPDSPSDLLNTFREQTKLNRIIRTDILIKTKICFSF